MKREFAVTVYVMNEHNEFLFIHHKKIGKWLPPGGHIETNESPDEAAIREVYEETGLAVTLVGERFPRETDYIRPFGIQKNLLGSSDIHEHIDLIYLAIINGDVHPIVNIKETYGVKWIDFKDIYSLDTFNETKKWCERFMQINGTTISY